MRISDWSSDVCSSDLWRARDIRCLFLDIDGVLTDGKLYIGPNGEETKTSYVRDGLGIKMMLKAGLHVAVISGRPSEAMRTRLSWLGVQHIALDTEDKAPACVRKIGRAHRRERECQDEEIPVV